MKKRVEPELEPKPLEKTIIATLTDLKAFQDRLSVADFICEIDIESISHGIAVQDAIAGMMDFSRNSINSCITDLEDLLEASQKEVAA